MDFDFTEEQNLIRDSLARLLKDRYDFDARRKALASPEGWQEGLWQSFAELGILAAPFSEDDGGLGGGAVDILVVMEEFGQALVVEPFIPSIVCAGGILKHAANADQKGEHLTAIMGGESIFAYAYAEPQSRFELANTVTQARKENGGYVLNGHKSVVIGAPWADHLIVSARTSGDQRDESGVSLFILPKNSDGVTCRDYPTVDGMQASEVYLENVALPAETLIGEEDNALPVMEKVADEAIAALCAEACGAMKALHAQTLEYARTRKQFGTPIGSFQVIQYYLVDMMMEYELSTSSTYMATLNLDGPDRDRKIAASTAKNQIGRSGRFCGQTSVQVHGGMGMTEEMAAGHYFKRLSMIDTMFGNKDWHLRRHTQLSRA